MEDISLRLIAAQAVSLIALALCIAAFASKRDERLLVLLIFANVAFAVHFVLFESWVAASVTVLIVLRVILVRRFKGSWLTMSLLLAANAIMAMLTWQGPLDMLPMTAAVLGTVGMFMLHGIPMRFFLGGAALIWTIYNLLIGSIGGTLAEAIILVTNFITISRMARDRRRELLV